MSATTRSGTRGAMRKKLDRPRIGARRLDEMIEAATVDSYGELEQITSWFTLIGENLALPFETMVLGVLVTVERIDLDLGGQIVAVCSRGRDRQPIPILHLPLPTPPVGGSEWIDAYRRWLGRG